MDKKTGVECLHGVYDHFAVGFCGVAFHPFHEVGVVEGCAVEPGVGGLDGNE